MHFSNIYSDAPYCSISEIYEGSKYVKTEVEKRSRVTPYHFHPLKFPLSINLSKAIKSTEEMNPAT